MPVVCWRSSCSYYDEVRPIQNQKVACANISSHWYILSYIQIQCNPSGWQLRSYFADFNDGVFNVVKISPAKVVLTWDSFNTPNIRFTHGVLARAKRYQNDEVSCL